MNSFFQKRDSWGNGFALWVLVAMIFVLPFAWSSVKHIRIRNDVENWLPSDDPSAVVLSWYRQHFPIEDRFLVMWDDSSLYDARVERFAERLEGKRGPDGVRRGGVPYIEGVLTPFEALDGMVDQNIKPPEALRRLEGVLIGSGPVKVALTPAGRVDSERTQRVLAELAKSKLGIQLDFLPRATEPGAMGGEDFQGEFEAFEAEAEFDSEVSEATEMEPESDSNIHAALAELWREHDFQVRWNQMHHDESTLKRFQELALGLKGRPSDAAPEGEPLIAASFQSPGAPLALAVAFSELASEERKEAFAAIFAAAEEVGIDPATLRMGGRSVASHALNEAVKDAAWSREAPIYELHRRSPVLLSAFVTVVLALVMLRSVRLAAMVISMGWFVTILTVALVPPTGGSMNMVLVVMPTLLMVLTVSAGIHVVNYWKHAAYQNMSTSVVEAVRAAKLPCTLAAVTTAIGLLSLTSSPLAPVRDFGVYSAVGVLISLLGVLVCLPSLLQFWPGSKPSLGEVDRRPWYLLGAALARFSTPVVIVTVVVSATAAYGLKYFRTETKVIRYFADDSRVVQDYNMLEGSLAGIIPVDTIVRFDAGAQEELNFLERMEVVRRVEEKLRRHPEISGALSLADFQPVQKPPQTTARLPQMRYHKRANETERRVKAEDSSVKNFLVMAEETFESPNADEPPLSRAGDELWRITAQAAIMSDIHYADLTSQLDDIVQSELKLIPGANHVVTGMVPIFLRTQQAVLESLIRSFGLAFGVIAVVMMILLRHPLAGLITMLPNLLPVGIVFGTISWFGWRVDIGTMITASVALGIAVDGTLHLLTWFRKSLQAGQSRSDAIATALSHCGPALWQTSTAVGIGLLVLVAADLLLINRFGLLMAALIGTALLADIIFLPALLAGVLGRLIEGTIQPADSSTPTQTLGQPPSSMPPHLEPVSSEANRVLRID